jgi:hypothetical protein
MKRIFFIITASHLLMSTFLYGQVGQTGLAFLKFGVGGRALGMGEAFTAIASDPTAMYYNPAGLSLTSYPQIIFMHKVWIQDTKTEFIAAKTNYDKLSFGIGVNATSVDNFELRENPGPSLGTFSARNVAIGFSASYSIDPSINIGFTAKYLYEKIFVEDATGMAYDFGGLYMTPWNIRFGFAVNNLGSMNKLRYESTKLPAIIRFGGAYESKLESFDGSFIGSAEIVNIQGENTTHLHVGIEFNYNNSFMARLGYQTGWGSKNFSTGFGVHYGMFNIDYAFVPVSNDLGSTHTFSLGIDFL